MAESPVRRSLPAEPAVQAICSVAIADRAPLLVIDDVAQDSRFAATVVRIAQAPLRFFAGAALLGPDGGALGTLCVMDARPRRLSPTQCAGLIALARQTRHLFGLHRQVLEQQHLLSQFQASSQRQAQAQAELERRNETLQHAASREELTGLLNRTALAQLRDNPRAMQKLQSASYSLALLDVDHFKQVNDRHGHLLGDRALRVVAMR